MKKTIYDLDYKNIDFRKAPELYLVGRGEQGVLMVEPYKSEIVPHWRFKTPAIAEVSAAKIYALYQDYRASEDFVGMDMARKFIQMGYTRSRRYANHRSGHKYAPDGSVLERAEDAVKAASALVFKRVWDQVEADELYVDLRTLWKLAFG